MKTDHSRLVALAQIFRLEYISATLPGVTITFFLCASSLTDVLKVPVIEGLLIIALMLFAGLGINAVVDREIDAKYATHKNRIPDAIERVGLKNVWVIIAVQILLAFALAIHLCFQFDSWLPLALVIAEVFFGYGYSLPPLQFKLRGVVYHAVSLTLATGVIPFVLSAYTYLGYLPGSLVMFIVGFATFQYGLEFSNQALDYLEDRAEGLKTPAVRLGVDKTLSASLFVPIAGGLISFAGLYTLLLERAAESGIQIGSGVFLFTWAVGVIVLVAGYYLPLSNTVVMRSLCKNMSPEDCVPKLPALCNYARWQASSVTGVATACAWYYFATLHMWS